MTGDLSRDPFTFATDVRSLDYADRLIHFQRSHKRTVAVDYGGFSCFRIGMNNGGEFFTVGGTGLGAGHVFRDLEWMGVPIDIEHFGVYYSAAWGLAAVYGAEICFRLGGFRRSSLRQFCRKLFEGGSECRTLS